MKLFRKFSAFSVVLALFCMSVAYKFASAQGPSDAAEPKAQAPAQSTTQDAKPIGVTSFDEATRKPKKVYTEDDFKASGFHGSYEGAEVDITDINLCDRNCFNQLISGTSFNAREGEQRRELTLQAVENTAKDADWQSTLHGYARYRVKACALMEEKRTILNAHTDPHNVTREQIQVEKEYEEKEAALRSEALSYLHQNRLDWKSAAGKGALRALEMKFAYYQISKISNAPCPARQAPQPAYEPRYSSESDDDPS